jgi:hypothetical protein
VIVAVVFYNLLDRTIVVMHLKTNCQLHGETTSLSETACSGKVFRHRLVSSYLALHGFICPILSQIQIRLHQAITLP